MKFNLSGTLNDLLVTVNAFSQRSNTTVSTQYTFMMVINKEGTNEALFLSRVSFKVGEAWKSGV